MRTVLKVQEGDDRREIYATTYQMRNPFHQFADAVATELDTFNYFSLSRAADFCPRGGRVLDVCCGRGLLIPFLRYRMRQPTLYVGVDLAEGNATWKDGKDPRRRGDAQMDDWGFTMIFVKASVEWMVEPIQGALPEMTPVFDLIAFTSAIEHMQPKAQKEALKEAAGMAKRGTILYLTCPVTAEDKDGYDCQYAAHIYEPKRSELTSWLDDAGWMIDSEIGLVTKITDVKKRLRGSDLLQAQEILKKGPRELTLPIIATLFPEAATEKAFICKLKAGSRTKKAPKLPPPSSGGLLDLI